MYLYCKRLSILYSLVFIMKHATAQTYGAITSDPTTVVVGGNVQVKVEVTGSGNTGSFRCLINDIYVQGINVFSDGTDIAGVSKEDTIYENKATLTADRANAITTLKVQFQDVTKGLKFAFDRNSAETASNDFPLPVAVCPAPIENAVVSSSTGTGCTVTNYNTFNCATTFACAEGYAGDEVTRTCQNNAVWTGDDIVCTETTTDTTTDPISGGIIAVIVIVIIVFVCVIILLALCLIGATCLEEKCPSCTDHACFGIESCQGETGENADKPKEEVPLGGGEENADKPKENEPPK